MGVTTDRYPVLLSHLEHNIIECIHETEQHQHGLVDCGVVLQLLILKDVCPRRDFPDLSIRKRLCQRDCGPSQDGLSEL